MDTVKHNLMCISSWVINYSWSNTKSNVRSIYSSTVMRIKIWRHAQNVAKRPRKHNKCALIYLPEKKCYLARWRNSAVCGLPVCKYRKLRARGREKWTLRGPSVRCATFTRKTKSHVLWKMKQPQPRFISLCTLTHIPTHGLGTNCSGSVSVRGWVHNLPEVVSHCGFLSQAGPALRVIVKCAQRGCRNVIIASIIALHIWQPQNAPSLLFYYPNLQKHCNSKSSSHRKWLIEVKPMGVNLECTFGFSSGAKWETATAIWTPQTECVQSGFNHNGFYRDTYFINLWRNLWSSVLGRLMFWAESTDILFSEGTQIRLGLLMAKAELCWHYMTRNKCNKINNKLHVSKKLGL